MKTNGTYQSPFTAREVVEILQKAKELGVQRLRLEGFEAEFEPWQMPSQSETPLERNNADVPLCEKCGHEKTVGYRGDWYCRPCWAERKRRERR